MYYVEIKDQTGWRRVAAYTRKEDAERDMVYANKHSYDPRPLRITEETDNGEPVWHQQKVKHE